MPDEGSRPAHGDLGFVFDLWVDFMRMKNDGTLTARASNLRPGLRLNVGDVILVGGEDSIPAEAQVVRLDISGRIVVSVLDVARKHGQTQP